MNYCVECRYVRGEPSNAPLRCDRYAVEKTEDNPVHGPIIWWERPFCEHLRAPGGQCGPEGVSWVKRSPPPQRIPIKLTDRLRNWFA